MAATLYLGKFPNHGGTRHFLCLNSGAQWAKNSHECAGRLQSVCVSAKKMTVLADPEGSVPQDSTSVCIRPGFGWIWTYPSCKVDPPCIHLAPNWDLPRGRLGRGTGQECLRRERPSLCIQAIGIPGHLSQKLPWNIPSLPFVALCGVEGWMELGKATEQARLSVPIGSKVGVGKHCLWPPCPSILGQVWGAHSLKNENLRPPHTREAGVTHQRLWHRASKGSLLLGV